LAIHTGLYCGDMDV